jgi:hypothetical protein
MRRLLLCALLTPLLAGCGHDHKTGSTTADSHSTTLADTVNTEAGKPASSADEANTDAETTTRVAAEADSSIVAIYDKVFGWYLKHVDDYCENDFDSPELLSASFWELYQKVLQHDSELQEVGFFDGDHWIQGQDWGADLSMRLVSTEVADSLTVRCHIVIQNCGTQTPLTVVMVKEHGRWLIDDFVSDPAQGLTYASEKKQMEMYLSAPDTTGSDNIHEN